MINIDNAKEYCTDYTKIENYEQALNDDTQTWICHHKNGITLNCGHEKLIELGLYYDRPACELIFLTKSEHNTLHKSGHSYNKGKHHSEETRNKQSESHKGIHAGSNNPSAKQCTINNKTYDCIKDAWLEICPEITYSAFSRKYKNNKL